MSLRAIVDIVVHIEEFRNIDLGEHGLYQIQFNLYHESRNKSQRFYAHPYNTQVSIPYDSKLKNKVQTSHNVIPYKIMPDEYTFASKAFVVRYCSEIIELCEFITFRTEIDIDENFNDITLIANFSLYFNNLSNYGGIDEWHKQANTLEKTIQLTELSNRKFKINGVLRGLNHFFPVIFDDFKYSLLEVTIHSSILELKLRQTTLENSIGDEIVHIISEKSIHHKQILEIQSTDLSEYLLKKIKIDFTNSKLSLNSQSSSVSKVSKILQPSKVVSCSKITSSKFLKSPKVPSVSKNKLVLPGRSTSFLSTTKLFNCSALERRIDIPRNLLFPEFQNFLEEKRNKEIPSNQIDILNNKSSIEKLNNNILKKSTATQNQGSNLEIYSIKKTNIRKEKTNFSELTDSKDINELKENLNELDHQNNSPKYKDYTFQSEENQKQVFNESFDKMDYHFDFENMFDIDEFPNSETKVHLENFVNKHNTNDINENCENNYQQFFENGEIGKFYDRFFKLLIKSQTNLKSKYEKMFSYCCNFQNSLSALNLNYISNKANKNSLIVTSDFTIFGEQNFNLHLNEKISSSQDENKNQKLISKQSETLNIQNSNLNKDMSGTKKMYQNTGVEFIQIPSKRLFLKMVFKASGKESSQSKFINDIILDLGKISGAILEVWQNYTELLRECNKQITSLLAKNYMQRFNDKVFNFIIPYKQILSNYKRVENSSLEIKHNIREENIEKALLFRDNEFYKNYISSTIEDMTFFQDLENIPIIFEEIQFEEDYSEKNKLNHRPHPIHKELHLKVLNTQYLFVFAHGFRGSSLDLRLVRNNISLLFPEGYFLMSESNQSNKNISILNMGINLAKEIKEFIVMNRLEKSFLKINFIGHSLGGLVIRAALPFLFEFKENMQTFCTFGTPHLGMAYSSNRLIDAGIWLLQKWNSTRALDELIMQDNPDISKCFLNTLSNYEGLEWFTNIILVSSGLDKYAPYESTRMELSKLAFEDYKNGKIYEDVVSNLNIKIKNSRLLKLDVNFVISKT